MAGRTEPAGAAGEHQEVFRMAVRTADAGEPTAGIERIAAIHIKNFKRNDCAGGLHGFGDDLLDGDVNFDAVKKALKKIGHKGPLTAEMIPFSRLPNLVLPDIPLARDTAQKLLKIFRG